MKKQPKYIYLITDDISYKIGISKNDPNKRLKTLQTGSANTLRIVDKFISNYANILEKTLHRTFELEHHRGEWFNLNNEQVEMFLPLCIKNEHVFATLDINDNFYFKKIVK